MRSTGCGRCSRSWPRSTNACIQQYLLAEQNAPKHFNRFLQENQLTELRAALPEFSTVLRKAQETTIKRAGINWKRHRSDPNAGRPRFRTGRFRTIEVDSPEGRPIRFTKLGQARLRLKGLPAIRLRCSREVPSEQQPVRISITLKGCQIEVRLSYKHPIPERSDPRESINPLGVDLGLALSMTVSTGDT